MIITTAVRTNGSPFITAEGVSQVRLCDFFSLNPTEA